MALPLLAAGMVAAPAVAGLFTKSKKTPQERAAEDAMGQANDLINLSMNPNDPRFKEMVEAESQGIRGGYLRNIRDLVDANSRQALLGRQQIFDPERRDESVFSAVNRAGQDAQLNARSSVLDRINSAIQRLQGQQAGYNNLAALEAGRRNQRRQAILGGLSAGSKGAQTFLGGTA